MAAVTLQSSATKSPEPTSVQGVRSRNQSVPPSGKMAVCGQSVYSDQKSLASPLYLAFPAGGRGQKSVAPTHHVKSLEKA